MWGNINSNFANILLYVMSHRKQVSSSSQVGILRRQILTVQAGLQYQFKSQPSKTSPTLSQSQKSESGIRFHFKENTGIPKLFEGQHQCYETQQDFRAFQLPLSCVIHLVPNLVISPLISLILKSLSKLGGASDVRMEFQTWQHHSQGIKFKGRYYNKLISYCLGPLCTT